MMAQNLGRKVYVGDVAQDARPPPYPVVRRVVLPVRDLVVRRRAVVRPRFLRHDGARDGLEARRNETWAVIGWLASRPITLHAFTETCGERRGRSGTGRLTSKSCRLRISVSGGRLASRFWRAFSWSDTCTSTLSTVSGSTRPRLPLHEPSDLKIQQPGALTVSLAGGVW